MSVKALDENEQPVHDVVIYAVFEGEYGTVTPSIPTTDANGEAHFKFRFGLLDEDAEIEFTADDFVTATITKEN